MCVCFFFTRNDALGVVCSLLCPGCDSGFDRDEENANMMSEAHADFFFLQVVAAAVVETVQCSLQISVGYTVC